MQEKDSKDWDEQALKMDEIYEGSTVTLVAASSCSVKNGFLQERELQYIPIPGPNNRDGGFTSTRPSSNVFLSAEWNKNKDEVNGPWTERGWTMQEGLLPRRLLHYTSSQMIWKCCEEERFERGVTKSLDAKVAEFCENPDQPGFGSGWFLELGNFMKFKTFPEYLRCLGYSLLSKPETFRLWYELIEEYAPRKFTDVKDRLPAISGLAKIFGSIIRSDEYVAGLWKPDLIRGLLWYVDGAKLTSRQSSHNLQDIDTAIPSWSWASVGYETVKNNWKTCSRFHALAVVEKVDLVEKQHPLGVAKGGRVTITGPLIKLPRLYHKEWKSREVSIPEHERRLSEIIEKESLGIVEDKYCFPPGGHFAAVQMLGDMYSLEMLVLEATGSIANRNEYRRVGVLTLRYLNKKDVASPEVIAAVDRYSDTRAARLQGKGKKKRNLPNQLVTDPIFMVIDIEMEGELWGGLWKTETVTIV
ncbi:hypothetical protein S7711_04055 [Stachybotrys chartarum IBT 7711]|uniref:Heterokaryon incompatibility domain-containing protein n=1 Tax=Stachybotrys chartarum (strain CBS 109288 / IBT 7711) TaxID=1280523 RepID=A0A084AR06_STACB|nr:hypothetical protein S7711_04055 [Stachybotrys chartarum IBT 7711]